MTKDQLIQQAVADFRSKFLWRDGKHLSHNLYSNTVEDFLQTKLHEAYSAGQADGMTHEAINCHNHAKESYLTALHDVRERMPEMKTHYGQLAKGFNMSRTQLLQAITRLEEEQK